MGMALSPEIENVELAGLVAVYLAAFVVIGVLFSLMYVAT